MDQQTVVYERPDKLITKEIITPGDYSVVPYEDARCKISITEISCTNDAGNCDIEPESRFFSKTFDGIVIIGDSDCFIDRDVELILGRMCCGEKCSAKLVYRDDKGGLVKEICCNIDLQEVMEEQLISDWGWQRLHEASLHHKTRGVELVKQGRVADAFRRFSKALKMLVAIEPINPEQIQEEKVKEMIDLKVSIIFVERKL